MGTVRPPLTTLRALPARCGTMSSPSRRWEPRKATCKDETAAVHSSPRLARPAATGLIGPRTRARCAARRSSSRPPPPGSASPPATQSSAPNRLHNQASDQHLTCTAREKHLAERRGREEGGRLPDQRRMARENIGARKPGIFAHVFAYPPTARERQMALPLLKLAQTFRLRLGFGAGGGRAYEGGEQGCVGAPHLPIRRSVPTAVQ